MISLRPNLRCARSWPLRSAMVTFFFFAGAAPFGAWSVGVSSTVLAISALLLVVAGPLGDLLSLFQCQVQWSSARDHVREQLGGLVSDVLELGDGHVLDAHPRLRIDPRLDGIDLIHDLRGERCELTARL